MEVYLNDYKVRIPGVLEAAAVTVPLEAGQAARVIAALATPDERIRLTIEGRTSPTGAVEKEIVMCTAAAGNNLTVTRARENTTARTFYAGATISNVLTAGMLADLRDGEAAQP